MLKNFFILLGIMTFIAPAVIAKDCGEKPTIQPDVPEGAKATREEIRAARVAVIDFSNKIDAYLACMDTRVTKFTPYMTKEQRDRVAEDLNKLAAVRTDIQVAINREIRAWRAAQQDSD